MLIGIQQYLATHLSRWAQRRHPYGEHNPYLEGVYAPVGEERTLTELSVTGHIPAELNGLLVRNGADPIAVSNPAIYHWFVGDGMVHGVRLRDGKAEWYRNRYVGADKAQDLLQRPRLPGIRNGIVDVVNTNIIGHGGRLWALVEAGASPIELDAELNSLRQGLFDYNRPAPFTAHPHLDPDTGDLHAISYDALKRNRVWYQVIDKHCQLIHAAPIKVKQGPMMHDCALTQQHVILLDLPVTFSFRSALKGASLPYKWNPSHAARVGILPKMGRQDAIRWLQLDPCFVFHTGNAWDLPNGDIQMNVVAHRRMFDRSIQGPEAQKITLERWTLPANGSRVIRQIISDRGQEFPRFDTRLTGQPSRYLYTVGADAAHPDSPQPLLRHDVTSGQCVQHHYGDDRVTGEAVFVPRDDSGDETDGWLLSFVYNLADDTGEVVILNADDLEGEPQAVIHLPVRVPMGFHCNWVGD